MPGVARGPGRGLYALSGGARLSRWAIAFGGLSERAANLPRQDIDVERLGEDGHSQLGQVVGPRLASTRRRREDDHGDLAGARVAAQRLEQLPAGVRGLAHAQPLEPGGQPAGRLTGTNWAMAWPR